MLWVLFKVACLPSDRFLLCRTKMKRLDQTAKRCLSEARFQFLNAQDFYVRISQSLKLLDSSSALQIAIITVIGQGFPLVRYNAGGLKERRR
jgi:hypothetical protein